MNHLMQHRLRRVLICAGVLLAVAGVGHAQDAARAEDRRDDLLATYLRTGKYADARRPIDEIDVLSQAAEVTLDFRAMCR